jgi:methyl-accepting chemotaxis protein
MNEFRKEYNEKMSKYFLMGLAFHLPIFVLQAWYFKTELWVALGLSSLVLLGPLVSWLKDKSHPRNAYFIAFSTVAFSAIMIHLGKGMIEMHFHIFASLAILSLLGYRGPILLATATVAIHHIGFWLFLPESVFNYEAGFGIVLLHATFVIFETIPTLVIANKFYNFIAMQGEVLTQLEHVATDNKESSLNLKNVASSLSSAATEQANSVQETVSALAEIKSMIKVAHESVEASSNIVKEGTEIANNSHGELSNLAQGMRKLESSIENLEEIKSIVKKIKSKTNVINDIVFKTQLLSFNASIEAARAGQHGKGFAVVAEEVGKLAQLSGDASQEIDNLIFDSDEKVGQIVESIKSNVAEGSDSTESVVQSFHMLNEQFQQVDKSMHSIHSANEEKEKGIEEVSKAMEQLSIVAQTNQNEADTLSNYSQEISESSHNLLSLVEEVKKRLDQSSEGQLPEVSTDESQEAGEESETPVEISLDEAVSKLTDIKITEEDFQDIEKEMDEEDIAS